MLTQWRPLWSLSSETPTPTISTTSSPPPSLSSSSGRGDERKDLSGAGEEEKKQNEEKEKEGENKRKREKSDDGSRREESKRFKEENGSKQIKREEEEGEKWKEEKEEEDHEEKKIHLGDIKSSSSPSWNFGSGYPGDALTLKFLNENFDEVFGFDSSLVRFSWSTAKLIFEKRGVPVDWYDEVDDGDDGEKDEASGGENKDGNLSKAKKGRQSRITSFFQMRPQGFKSSSSSPSPNISRPAFFVRNHLQLLSDLPLS
ncbi:ribonuclease h1 large subunit [Cystoisospora suis]|uniref:Ribonuclease H2 subunit A n=1 Tax=Cystoisospora suis TaxID=483139 RepID=A0A2C6KTB3_9APIC|nr:ribonuclease h1 large subunit [Cystoisospora suis]